MTNVVDRPTRTAAELTRTELRAGAEALAGLVREYRPRVLAVLGITAWRVAFDRPRAVAGLQPERIGGATTWAVPNPSGLNAHAQLPDLAVSYARLRSSTVSGRERSRAGPGPGAAHPDRPPRRTAGPPAGS